MNIDKIIFSRKHFVHISTIDGEYLGDMEILLLLFTLLLCLYVCEMSGVL